MDCLETRKRLSSHADGELKDPERREVSEHIEVCEACRRQLSDQGALDMLLKKHFAPVPPEGYFDTFWPSVDQRVDGEDAAGSNGESNEEVVFKSSPALKMLNIPERKAPDPEPVAVVEQSTPQAPAAPPPTSYRWPVAFVLAATVITGGFLLHKKMNPPTPSSPAAVDPHGTIAGAAGAAEEPVKEAVAETADAGAATAADAMVLAAATGIDASGSVTDPSTASSERKVSKRPKRSRRTKKAAPKKDEAAAAPKPVAAPDKAPEKLKKSRKGGSDLDSLIDNAIGGRRAAPAPKAAKAAPAADANLPEQLEMNQIRAGMRKISGRVQACYDKFQIEGKATARLTISKSGVVKSVLIKGKFFGTDTGGCVAKAVKKARFPKFRGKEMTITYPFMLQ